MLPAVMIKTDASVLQAAKKSAVDHGNDCRHSRTGPGQDKLFVHSALMGLGSEDANMVLPKVGRS